MVKAIAVGTTGMMPVYGKFLASFYLAVEGHALLIDCGENTQVGCARAGIHVVNIDTILITHCHADHVTGLPGLLATMNGMGRTKPLTIICPVGTKQYLKSFISAVLKTKFFIQFWEINEKEKIQFEFYSVQAIQCEHTVTCFGYSIEIGRRPSPDINKLTERGVARDKWAYLLAKGACNDKEASQFISEYRAGIKVVYATDTCLIPNLVTAAQDADLLVLEGACPERCSQVKNGKFKHLTFEDAARVAKDANARELWLTHYSNCLQTPYKWEGMASDIFSKTYCAFDGLTRELTFGGDLQYNVDGSIQVSSSFFYELMSKWRNQYVTDLDSEFNQGDLVEVKCFTKREHYAQIVAKIETATVTFVNGRMCKVLELRLFGFQKEKSNI